MAPDTDPVLFISGFEDVNKKKFFCFLLFEGIFTPVFKDKKSYRGGNSGNQGFSIFICLMMEGSGSVQIMMDPDLDLEAKQHTDYTDPDPSHWSQGNRTYCRRISARWKDSCGIADPRPTS